MKKNWKMVACEVIIIICACILIAGLAYTMLTALLDIMYATPPTAIPTPAPTAIPTPAPTPGPSGIMIYGQPIEAIPEIEGLWDDLVNLEGDKLLQELALRDWDGRRAVRKGRVVFEKDPYDEPTPLFVATLDNEEGYVFNWTGYYNKIPFQLKDATYISVEVAGREIDRYYFVGFGESSIALYDIEGWGLDVVEAKGHLITMVSDRQNITYILGDESCYRIQVGSSHPWWDKRVNGESGLEKVFGKYPEHEQCEEIMVDELPHRLIASNGERTVNIVESPSGELNYILVFARHGTVAWTGQASETLPDLSGINADQVSFDNEGNLIIMKGGEFNSYDVTSINEKLMNN